MLARCANGFGAVAFHALLAEAAAPSRESTGLHHRATARSVIYLYMDGGPSQVDTFDPKPLLSKYNGEPPNKFFKVEPTQFDSIGRMLGSPWKFAQHGESGLWVSDLFPNIAKRADDLAVVRSVVSKFSEHTSANYFLHTGSGLQGRPSMGSWLSYGLGKLNANLPSFVVLNGGLIPPGGLDNFNAGFLPAAHQGSVFKTGANPVANIKRLERSEDTQRKKLDLVRKLDRLSADRSGRSDAIESAIINHETAFRMQSAVPELMDIAGETTATQKLYGLDAAYPHTRTFGRQCLIARRLVERGVRFIELTCPGTGHDRWDQHSNLKKGHEDNSLAVDQPIAALLMDLKTRGLLDSTLVVWSGEFGRTPFAQGGNGRDHNPFGFSIWMAGGGVRGGMVYGETDEWGYKAVKDKVEIHDLHATMLHCLGIDHKRLTMRFGGRDMRLTDVHGEVLTKILR
ncbi:MAG: DUF1501 domain-containing protein [Planctomycetia bacterium]|nr:DUF1501 domain-containing protein [Planctomycetia bacterium]